MERWDVQEAREQPAHGGRSLEQVQELWFQTARSATVCAACFNPLALTDTVTMEYRSVGSTEDLRVPVCLVCTLTNRRLKAWFMKRKQRSQRSLDHLKYKKPKKRTRCLGCGRPMRLYSRQPTLNQRTCCTDCARLAKNKRNAERRRVVQLEQKCVVCGEPFMPKRKDATTCSNRCRQKLFRQEHSAAC